MTTAIPKPRSLWAIDEDLRALEDLLEENGGDITECEAVVDEWLASLGEEMTAKMDGYAAYVLELQARAEARMEEARRLQDRARMDDDLAGFLKCRMRDFFAHRGIKKLETARYKLSLAQNGGKAPLVLSCEPEKLPLGYRKQRVTFVADQDRIREALERGEELSFASLGERGQHMKIL